MIQKIGLIGNGVMAQSIMKGVIDKGVIDPNNIYVYGVSSQKLLETQKTLGINIVESNVELTKVCDILILAVKPDICSIVLKEISSYLFPHQIIISIAAGWSTSRLRKAISKKAKILKVMMNTPTIVGEGVIIISKDNDLSVNELERIKAFFSAIGSVFILEDDKMFATSSVSGTVPACVAMHIESLSDAGVMNGLSREMSLKMAAQAVMGSAKWVLESGEHPGVLKDQVCTPGGVTIEAVTSLEEDSFRGTVIRAANKSTKKSRDLMCTDS